MADVVTPAVRSAMMSRIRGKDTQPELLLRRGLFRRGVRFRLHSASLPGRPDLVIRKHNTVILVHGCFWHAHQSCAYFRIPSGNRQFWVDKLGGNRERDARSVENLRTAGWRVAVVWECACRLDGKSVLDVLYDFIVGDAGFLEIAGGKVGDRLKFRSKISKLRPLTLDTDVRKIRRRSTSSPHCE